MAKTQTRSAPAKPQPMAILEAAADGVTEDAQLVEQAGSAIASFVRNMNAFFRTAQEIEKAAKATLVTAQALTVPETKEQDEQLQRFIIRTNADKKAAEAHWGIAQIISRFHKRVTAGRGRATDPLDAANMIGNSLHNRYVAAEERRVREENERIDRETREKQDAIRAAELQALETAALKAEADNPNLSAREAAFVDLIVAGIVPSQAAHRAGYKDTTMGLRQLEQGKIATAIKGKQQAIAIRRQAEALAQAPPDPVHTREYVTRAVTKIGSERSTSTMEIYDEAAFIEAIFAGKQGIPRDCLTIDQARCNHYARENGAIVVDRWSGVRVKKATKVI